MLCTVILFLPTLIMIHYVYCDLLCLTTWSFSFYLHRASVIRNHNNNSLSTPPPLRLYSFKSSESDLSSSTPPPISRLPLPHTELSPGPVAFSPGGGRRYSHLRKPQHSLLTPPSSAHSDGPYFTFNGTASASSGSPNSIPSPGAMSAVIGSGVGGMAGSGELVPVALAKCERGSNMGFSVTAGGHGGRQTLVKKVWDHRQCNGLQSGDAIVKINGADVQSLSFAQVEKELIVFSLSFLLRCTVIISI